MKFNPTDQTVTSDHDHFHSSENMIIGGVDAIELVKTYGSPLYVYDQSVLEKKINQWQSVLASFSKSSINYSVKANANLKILSYFRDAGINFDIVSGGELAKLLAVNVNGQRIIFSGVGKSKLEIEQALVANIGCFNVESLSELARLTEIGIHHQIPIPVAIRVNPNIIAKTHPYISTGASENKFGMSSDQTFTAIDNCTKNKNLEIQGLACHIGSNLHDPEPYLQAAELLINLALELKQKGINLKHLDFGGGIGVSYQPDVPAPKINDFIEPILTKVFDSNLDLEVVFEPGRNLIAEAGTLITKIEYIKSTNDKQFMVVDASMTELLRPALYQSWHDIVAITIPKNGELGNKQLRAITEVVGPVCESSDILGKARAIDAKENDYLAIKNVGAYGFVMSNNYNSRPRPAEVWVENQEHRLIRKRETYQDLIQHEII